MNVLVVDDQRSARRVLLDALEGLSDVQVFEATSKREALEFIPGTHIDVALVDLRLSEDVRNREGLEVATRLREDCGALVVMVTGLSDQSEVRRAIRAGVFDYMLKEELTRDAVHAVLEEARAQLGLEREVLRRRASGAVTAVDGFVGASAAMERLRDVVRRVAVFDRPALVTGPSGSGKELVAQALHALGPNPSAPMLELNCGALPEHLIEAQLFGHERGAFTGADRRSPGLLAAVGEGTLFLDEVAELPLAQQPKFLRVLETRRFRAVGATEEQVFKGRVVAATHADLEERVREQRFRADLFHRLAVLRVRVPGLDERADDVPALVAHFARLAPREVSFTDAALQWLTARQWSGHVRELRNFVDQAAVFIDARPIDAPALAALVSSPPPDVLGRLAASVLALAHEGDRLELVESLLIQEALRRAGGNKSGAARLLGVHRKRIERRVGLDEDDQAAG